MSHHSDKDSDNYHTMPHALSLMCDIATFAIPDLRKKQIMEICPSKGLYSVKVMKKLGYNVKHLKYGTDFLSCGKPFGDCIITNPPFSLLISFVEKCIKWYLDHQIKSVLIAPISRLGNDNFKSLFLSSTASYKIKYVIPTNNSCYHREGEHVGKSKGKMLDGYQPFFILIGFEDVDTDKRDFSFDYNIDDRFDIKYKPADITHGNSKVIDSISNVYKVSNIESMTLKKNLRENPSLKNEILNIFLECCRKGKKCTFSIIDPRKHYNKPIKTVQKKQYGSRNLVPSKLTKKPLQS